MSKESWRTKYKQNYKYIVPFEYSKLNFDIDEYLDTEHMTLNECAESLDHIFDHEWNKILPCNNPICLKKGMKNKDKFSVPNPLYTWSKSQ